MSAIFANKKTVALYTKIDELKTKLGTMLKSQEDVEFVFFDNLDSLKEHLNKENVNICFCDIDGDEYGPKHSQELMRELLGLKRGTCYIAMSEDIKLINLTTLYRLGVFGHLFKASGHLEFSEEYKRALVHIDSWKHNFDQVLADKSMERELEDLLGL